MLLIYKQLLKKLKMASIIELMEENGGRVELAILDVKLQLLWELQKIKRSQSINSIQ